MEMEGGVPAALVLALQPVAGPPSDVNGVIAHIEGVLIAGKLYGKETDWATVLPVPLPNGIALGGAGYKQLLASLQPFFGWTRGSGKRVIFPAKAAASPQAVAVNGALPGAKRKRATPESCLSVHPNRDSESRLVSKCIASRRPACCTPAAPTQCKQ